MEDKIRNRIKELEETVTIYLEKKNGCSDVNNWSDAQYFAMKVDQINFAIRELKDLLNSK